MLLLFNSPVMDASSNFTAFRAEFVVAASQTPLASRFSALSFSTITVARGATTRRTLIFTTDRRNSGDPQISVTGTGVSVTTLGTARTPDGDTVVTNIEVAATGNAGLGPRDLRVAFAGEVKTFAGAITVARRRAVIFAIDGLSKQQFDDAISQADAPSWRPGFGSAFSYIFASSQAKHQSVARAEITTFPPMTFSRWATIFSGAPRPKPSCRRTTTSIDRASSMVCQPTRRRLTKALDSVIPGVRCRSLARILTIVCSSLTSCTTRCATTA